MTPGQLSSEDTKPSLHFDGVVSNLLLKAAKKREREPNALSKATEAIGSSVEIKRDCTVSSRCPVRA